jgi:hypothetical protein
MLKPSLLCLLIALAATSGELPAFKEHVVTSGLKMGYQLVAVDLTGDGRKDLIAIDERSTEIAWFENPTWQRHVLLADAPRPINMDCWDYDGDGKPECALALGFETNPEKSVGQLLILKAGADVRQSWTAREIDRVPTAHRVRWIDADGTGKKLLLLSPMLGLKARAPLYDDDTPVYLYRPGEWNREVLAADLHGIVHAIAPVAWRARGEQFFTASFQGLRLYEPAGAAWKWTEFSKGDPRPCPECGSSEVRVGHLGKARFIATIEPWHGNQVVVYIADGQAWKRIVIEDAMVNGHALAVGDLDGDGRDEIVAGFRGKGFRLSVYQASDARGEKWTRTVLDDGGIAAADCKIDDFTGDGRPDIACIGASTANIKLYENLGPRAR